MGTFEGQGTKDFELKYHLWRIGGRASLRRLFFSQIQLYSDCLFYQQQTKTYRVPLMCSALCRVYVPAKG